MNDTQRWLTPHLRAEREGRGLLLFLGRRRWAARGLRLWRGRRGLLSRWRLLLWGRPMLLCRWQLLQWCRHVLLWGWHVLLRDRHGWLRRWLGQARAAGVRQPFASAGFGGGPLGAQPRVMGSAQRGLLQLRSGDTLCNDFLCIWTSDEQFFANN